ncbi:flagellar hook-length control protein FliK [Desulforhopalus sp. 52FAK]
MTQLLNVQMPVRDLPKVQIEQSGTNSTSSPNTGTGESFNSVLRSSLPKDGANKTQGNQNLTSQQQSGSTVSDTGHTPDDNGIANESLDSAILEFLNQFNIEPGQQHSPDALLLSQEQLMLFQQQLASLTDATSQAFAKLIQPNISKLENGNTSADQLGLASGAKSFSAQKAFFTDPAIQHALKATPQTITPQQEALMERIQTILNGGGEAGILSIKNVMAQDGSALRSQLFSSSAQLQTLTVEQTTTKVTLTSSEGFTALEDGVFAPTLRNKQQLSGVRHDTTQQFYDAKSQPGNILSEAANLSGNKQGDDMGQQPGSGFSQSTPFSSSPEAPNTFAMPIGSSTDPLTTQTLDFSKTTTVLPSGTMVQDQDVIQQLVERFRINQRQLDSKIQLKLHPVELGKMEIDLTVKEGSIRANVVAQSQHVQQILERNLSKLKTVLEQQGFNVEDITVTRESDMVGSFDLFDQQLNNSDSSQFLSKNDNSETNTPFILDEFQDSYIETNSGVNVKV